MLMLVSHYLQRAPNQKETFAQIDLIQKCFFQDGKRKGHETPRPGTQEKGTTISSEEKERKSKQKGIEEYIKPLVIW